MQQHLAQRKSSHTDLPKLVNKKKSCFNEINYSKASQLPARDTIHKAGFDGDENTDRYINTVKRKDHGSYACREVRLLGIDKQV